MRERHAHIKAISKDVLGNPSIPHFRELQDIYQILQEQKVDAGLVGQKGRTLYDFVDAQSVQALQGQIVNETAALREILKEVDSSMVQVDRCVENLTVLQKAINLPDTNPSMLEEKMELQRGFLRDIEHHYKELSEIESKSSTGLAEDRKKHILTLIRRYENLIASVAQGIESSAVEHGESYERALNFFTSLERDVPRLQNQLSELQVKARVFEEKANTVQGILHELKNLAAWYRQFHKAYGEMLKEIKRRHIQMEKHQNTISMFQAELDKVVQEESLRREQFSMTFGRYLPPGLCPALFEPVTSCRVLPPSLTTDLPRTLVFVEGVVEKKSVKDKDKKSM
uniref:Autophagy protein ATG17-like domain-containing protein n=2 Tax=Lotharella globosa TaxID=91324 RepID=A0A6V3NY49_9EUKA